MGVKKESITYVCDGCGVEEIVNGEGMKGGFRAHLSLPVGWESIPTRNHEYLTVCYDCFQKQDDVSKIKVLSFTDGCGHSCVIDVTDPRNRVQVYHDILKDGYPHGNHEEDLTKLLDEAQTVLTDPNATNVRLLTIAGDLIEALDWVDMDDICSGRDGLEPFTPSTS